MTEHLTKRIGQQREDVFCLMYVGRWRTLNEIQREIHKLTGRYHSEASISARLRDFRKVKYGSYTVNRRKRSGNLYEYQVLQPKPKDAVQIPMFKQGARA